MTGQTDGMVRPDMMWLAGQAVLLFTAFVVIPVTDGIAGRIDVDARPVGAVLVVLAVVIGVSAVLRLGRQLVPQPTPVQDGDLIDTGMYRVVRHPIYLAVLIGVAGAVAWWLSIAGLVLLVVAFVFFDRKSTYEERLLAAAYPGYPQYRAKVRWKLVPGVR